MLSVIITDIVQVQTERQINVYTNEAPYPLCGSNDTERESASQVPQDDYVEMHSHCVQLETRDDKRYLINNLL